MTNRYTSIVVLSLCCLVFFSLTSLIHAQTNLVNDSSQLDNLKEIPATLYVAKNPETNKLEYKGYTLNQSITPDSNKENTIDTDYLTDPDYLRDFKKFSVPCNDIVNNQPLVRTNYIIIGIISNPVYLESSTDSNPLSIEIHDVSDPETPDTILLDIDKRYEIEPVSSNVICQYDDKNYIEPMKNKTKNISFFSSHCPNSFHDTIHNLKGGFTNQFKINFTSYDSEKPNIKIALKKELGSDVISGYMGKYSEDGVISLNSERGNFDINSTSIACSFFPLA